MDYAGFSVPYYNIPSNNRELQPFFCFSKVAIIITYQVITGNYNKQRDGASPILIITYQVITGNYNRCTMSFLMKHIITYQVITGNYNKGEDGKDIYEIITYQVITGNYNPCKNET